MTRIAAGHPGIWPDICIENRAAILEVLDLLVAELTTMRTRIDEADRSGLLEALTLARAARLNLPGRVAATAELAEIRIPVPDRPGVLAEITTLASELGVNIHDLEIAHSSEGPQGVLILVVEESSGDVLRAGLIGAGYRPSIQKLA